MKRAIVRETNKMWDAKEKEDVIRQLEENHINRLMNDPDNRKTESQARDAFNKKYSEISQKWDEIYSVYNMTKSKGQDIWGWLKAKGFGNDKDLTSGEVLKLHKQIIKQYDLE